MDIFAIVSKVSKFYVLFTYSFFYLTERYLIQPKGVFPAGLCLNIFLCKNKVFSTLNLNRDFRGILYYVVMSQILPAVHTQDSPVFDLTI